MAILAQAIIDICGWFLPGFAVVVVVNWVTSLFRRA